MVLIGLGHRARQGKDEIGKVLQAQHGFEVLHFADALKEEVAEYFGWSEDNKNVLAKDIITQKNWGRVKSSGGWRVYHEEDGWFLPAAGIFHEKHGDIPFGNASLLQWWGTEFRRYQDNDYWVKRIVEKISNGGFKDTVVCDMRFPNEAAAIKKLNGLTVRVCRMTPTGQFVATDRDPNHPSEIALNEYPFDHTEFISDHDTYIPLSIPRLGIQEVEQTLNERILIAARNILQAAKDKK